MTIKVESYLNFLFYQNEQDFFSRYQISYSICLVRKLFFTLGTIQRVVARVETSKQVFSRSADQILMCQFRDAPRQME